MSWTKLTLSIALIVGVLNFASSTSLFGIGKEYRYNYETLVTAGQEQPTSFASAYKIKGILRVNAISTTTISVGLDNLTIGLYNGPWTYFPIPDFQFFDVPDLSTLGERFHIVTENGKFKTLILNDLEPEWASNMKRGLATFLQLDFESITSFDQMQVFNTGEMTTMGECNTKYEVLPASTTPNRMVRVNKFRNHADCRDLPKRTRLATQNFYQCSNGNNRDIINSTAYAVYELEVQEAQPLLKGITLYSSILAWPFTSSQSYQFSWLNMTISFNSAFRYGSQAFPPPENAENHEDLIFTFEQPDPTDPEDENPDLNMDTILYHQTGTDTNPEAQEQIMNLCHKKIEEVAESLGSSEPYLSNLERFHGDSPLSVVQIISALDYEHLTQCQKRYSGAASQSQQKLTEFQLFLDGLIMSGTSQSSLLLRDILLSTQDAEVISRITAKFPHFIRNPTEALATEMDLLFELLNKTEAPNRMLEFSLATLIGRCCKKTLCTTSGLLDKYINYFENQLAVATNFEARTSAVLGLRNLAYGRALDKVQDIATGALVLEQTTRVQAIWALSAQEPQRVFDALLPVFYNRTESCEIRTNVFTLLMSLNPNERILHDIAYFMWSEYCPQTYNIVRSFLANAVKSKSPCNRVGDYARTILNYLPPGVLDPLRTSIYTIDYFDPTHGLGHEFYSLVQKSGTSTLPTSVYFGVNNFIGGFAGPSMGVFIRMEGLEKKITSMFTKLTQTSIEEVQKILSKIDVTQRPTTPLRLEFILVWQNRVIVYFAADEKTISSLPAYLSELTQFPDFLRFSVEQSSMLGGAFYQQPLEIGAPVSIGFGVVGTGAIAVNISQPDGENAERSARTQFNLFVRSGISNHVPVIGTIHAVSTLRTLRLVIPRNVKLQLGDNYKLSYVVPSEKDPILLMAHGTSLVLLLHDSASNVKQQEIKTLLQKSCPTCESRAIISRGAAARKSRYIYDTPNFSPIPGVVANVQFFDCERDHSRNAILKRFKSFYSDENKNTGIYNLGVSKWFLTSQQVLDYLFWSPSYETCGIKFAISQDGQVSKKLESVEIADLDSEIQVSNPVEGGKLFNGTITTTTNLVYSQQEKLTFKTVLEYRYYDADNGTKDSSTKFQFNDLVKQTRGSICLDYTSSLNQLPKDVLAYDGESEPYFTKDIQLKYGRSEAAAADTSSCLSNVLEVKINAKASRSFEQITEAEAAVSSPYRECKAQKNSGQFFGSSKFTPPTLQCFAAVLDQTNLRAANSTIYYKVSKKIPEKWRRKLLAAAGFIYPTTASDDDSGEQHSHKLFSNELARDQNYIEGFLEVDVKMGKDETTKMDVHSQTSNGKEFGEEQHAHGIDLSSIPDYLRPKPIPARFSPYLTFGFQSGFLGQCTVNSGWVSTLDSFAFNANISDCPTLMSADCGTNSQYAVLVNKISADKIGLKIQLGNENVELKDVSDTVMLNGKATKIPNREKYSAGSFELLKNDDEVYLITRLNGMHIRYTGYFATVTLDSRFRGVHCGICGHWDSSFFNDMMMGPNTSCPATAMLASPQEFVDAYVLGDGKACKTANVAKCAA